MEGRKHEFDDDEAEAVAAYSQAFEAQLPADHRLRQLAALRLASLRAEQQDFAAAERFFSATGMTAEQCSLIDLEPTVSRGKLTVTDYPADLPSLGFGSDLLVDFDVDQTGTVVNPRVIYAYPPLLFNEDLLRSLRRFRYNPIYRDGGTIGCSGASQAVKFITRY